MSYRPKISLNMIVKNEGENLDRGLKSIADLVDEMIIVDTGSTDNTKEIAKKYGAKVYDYVWHDHFADARNEALKHSTGDWIIWLDGDEYFDEENRDKLKALFASLKDENVVYMTNQVNTVRDHPGEEILFSRPSLFRNRPDIRWRYRVHEQILACIEDSGGRVIKTDIRLFHPGYYEPEVHKRKVERNIRLLHIDDNEHPNDPFILFHLGLMYQSLKRYAEAIPYWPRTVQLFIPQHPLVAKGFYLWAEGLRNLGCTNEAIQISQEGLSRFPNNPELLIQQAQLLAFLGHIPMAEECLKRLINSPVSNALNASFNPGIYTYQAYSVLGELYAQTNRQSEAEGCFKKALEFNPEHRPSLNALIQLYEAQGKKKDSDAISRRLESLSN